MYMYYSLSVEKTYLHWNALLFSLDVICLPWQLVPQFRKATANLFDG